MPQQISILTSMHSVLHPLSAQIRLMMKIAPLKIKKLIPSHGGKVMPQETPTLTQGLSQDHETGCPKLTIFKFLGVLFFKEDHNILRLQP